MKKLFIPRDISKAIRSGAQQMPVVAVIGPRQSGKSSLCQELFPQHTYLDMQDAELFEFANTDPKGFLQTYKNKFGLIIDEAQYAPKLFAQIKVEADKDPQPGYYILSGSQNFLLHEKISESLAGRVYFYTLLPLSIKELKSAQLLCAQPEEQLFKGFYPRIYQQQLNSQEYYQNYVATYVERDIRSIKNLENIVTFQKFMQLCALRIGTTLNLTELATVCGISIMTVRSWISLLQTSFIVFLLPSYHDNLGKRVTKSPKLYFYDVGLAATLMNITPEIIVSKRSIYGAIFENMIIVDVMKNSNAQGTRPTLTFFRDSNQHEIDLIIETGGHIIPVEIKASATMSTSFFDTLTWFQEQLTKNSPNNATQLFTAQPIVVYGGKEQQKRTKGSVVSWNSPEDILPRE